MKLEDRLDQAYVAACAGTATGPRAPALDLIDNDASFLAVLEMPGVAKEDVKITVAGRRPPAAGSRCRPSHGQLRGQLSGELSCEQPVAGSLQLTLGPPG